MHSKRKVIQFLILGIFFVFLLVLIHFSYFRGFGLTGFAIFEDSGDSFQEGTFSNVTFNGSSVILDGEFSGEYTSKVFDAGALSLWNNISLDFVVPVRKDLYAVDAVGSVYGSADGGTIWTLQNSNYGRGASTEELFGTEDYLFIVFGGSAREVWRSGDLGISWNVVNNSFADSGLRVSERDSVGNIYVTDASGDIYKSADEGVSWTLQGDFNGGNTNNPLGMAINLEDEIYVVDGSGSVYRSIDEGVSWTLQNSGYGGSSGTDDMEVDSEGNLYILLNTRLYVSNDDGLNWTIGVEDISPYANTLVEFLIDSEDNFYVLDSIGRVFESIDYGESWTEKGDINGGSSSTPKGIGDFDLSTDLIYQVRGCNLANCSDREFIGPDGTSDSFYTEVVESFDLNGTYFQYKVFFYSDSPELSPFLNEVIIDYKVIAYEPTVNIQSPVDGFTYGDNNSIPLNFSVISEAVDSCWYSLDAGINNVSIVDCMNTSISVEASGSYEIIVYANETLENLLGSDSSSFNVEIGAPEIYVISPSNGSYTNNQQINITFNAFSDLGLDVCDLYQNIGEGFMFNQRNDSVVSGEPGYFLVNNLTAQKYIWRIYCNNTQGVSANSQEFSLIVDLDSPVLEIIEPNGTYNDTEDIPFNFTVEDTSSPVDSCLYNLSFAVGGQVVEVNVLTGCQSTTINVVTETDYKLDLTANDSAGNTNTASTVFVVDTGSSSSGGSGSSGGGGGGGGSSFQAGVPKMSYSGLSEISVKTGRSEIISFPVINSGGVFLNSCSIVSKGVFADFVSKSDQVESLTLGQKASFLINLAIPLDFEEGVYNLDVEVNCEETSLSIPIKVNVLPSEFDFKILSTERDGLKLKIVYFLEEKTGENKDVALNYSLRDLNGRIIFEGQDVVFLPANSQQEYSLEYELPKDVIGEFRFFMFLEAGEDSVEVVERVILSSGGLTGFAISGENQKTLFSFVMFILFAIVGYLLVKFFRNYSKKSSKLFDKKRQIIRLNLKE